MRKGLKKQDLVKGTLILGFCMMIAKILGMFFRIPVQKLIGDEGMGYFQMSYPIYFLFTALAGSIPYALSKMISEYAEENNYIAIRKVVNKTLVTFVGLTCIMSFTLIIFGKEIISALNWHENSYYTYIVNAIAPIFVIILFILRGAFQGLSSMTPSGVSQIVEQIGRVCFGVAFAYIFFSMGTKYAAAGAALGTVIGAILAVIYLGIKYIKTMKQLPKTGYVDNENDFRGKILEEFGPIAIAAAIITLIGLVDNLIVPNRLISAGFDRGQIAIMFGQTYGKAATLNNVPLALSTAICASIFPAIGAEKNKILLNNKINIALKLSFVIAIPSALGLYFMAYPIMDLVFLGNSAGYEMLRYFAISTPFLILYHTTASILQSTGKENIPIISLCIAFGAKIVSTYILAGIYEVNIAGAVIGSILAFFIAAMINSVYIIANMRMNINLNEAITKPLIASIIMIIGVVFSYNYIYNYTMSNTVSTLISITIGVIIFGVMIVGLKIFTYEEIKSRKFI